MRAITLLLLVAPLLAACRRPTELRGFYVNNGKTGFLFACGAHRQPLHVPDSAVAAAYRRKATAPGVLMFVRLQAELADSGSVYGGVRYVLRPRVLEMRLPRTGDCPDAIQKIAPVSSHGAASRT